jgi:hypothetical protein
MLVSVSVCQRKLSDRRNFWKAFALKARFERNERMYVATAQIFEIFMQASDGLFVSASMHAPIGFELEIIAL